MYDLSDTSSKESHEQQKRDVVTENKIAVRKRKSDGEYMLFNASKVQLQSTADFDRMIGLLLGRRSAMSRLAHILLQKHSVNNNINNSTAFQLIEEIDPWVLNTSSLLRNGFQPFFDTTTLSSSQASFDQAPNTSSSDSMFISISACGGGVSKSKPTVDFNFVCPCGKTGACLVSDALFAFYSYIDIMQSYIVIIFFIIMIITSSLLPLIIVHIQGMIYRSYLNSCPVYRIQPLHRSYKPVH